MEPRLDRSKRVVVGVAAMFIALIIFNYTRTLGTHGWIGAMTAFTVAFGLVEFSRGRRFKWVDLWYVGSGFALVGLMENYLARNKAADDLSILFMAMIFGASQAYMFARWWLRRTGRTSLP